MWGGPVFASEMRAIARRPRHHAARAGLGLVVIAAIWAAYRVVIGPGHATAIRVTGGQAQAVTKTAFAWIVMAEAAALVALLPATVAGTIAEQGGRKTLLYLLASDLSAAEIVLGKLLPRLLQATGWLAVGVPILAFLTLAGGLAPGEVAQVFVGLAGVATFLGGVSILASVVAPGPREATLAAYAVALLWLAAPPLVGGPIRRGYPGIFAAIEPAYDVVATINPFTFDAAGPHPALQLAAILAALGVACAGLAILLLRPMARRGTDGPARRRRPRWRGRPECGDDPMAWKERLSTTRGGWLASASRAAFALIAVGLVMAAIRESVEAFEVLVRFGYNALGRGRGPGRFNDFIRVTGTALYTLGLLVSAVAASGSIASERDRDTWSSLLATPLDGPEILRAKRRAAARATRPILAMLLVLWAWGLIAGAIHPVGFVLATLGAWVGLRFARSLGMYASLVAPSTGRAAGRAAGLLAGLNLGGVFCCLPLVPDSALSLFPCSPLMMFLAPMSYQDVRDFLERDIHQWGVNMSILHRGGELAIAGALSLLFYGLGATVLDAIADRRFDRAADRPMRPDPR